MSQKHIAIFFLLITCLLVGCSAIYSLTPRGRWFHDAEQGSAEEQTAIGHAYYADDNYKRKIYVTKDGHVTPDPNKAESYFIVSWNKNEAAVWFRRAAEQGSAEAQYMLGTILERRAYMGVSGSDVAKQNYAEAADWYRKAAEQGHAKAQHCLGDMYAKGLGVAQNNAEAEKWNAKAHSTATEKYRVAAEKGDPTAQYELGCLYDYNIYGRDESVPLDLGEAMKWYRAAAYQGNADAQRALGTKYLYGHGVVKDEVEGLAWYYVSQSNDGTDSDSIRPVERKVGSRGRLAAQQRAKEISASIADGKQ